MWQAHLNYGIALARPRKFAKSLAPLDEATRRWRAASLAGPEHLRAHIWRLIAFLELNRLSDAAAEVAVLVELEHDPWVQLYVLRYLAVAGRAATAVAAIELIERDNPENVDTLYALALAYHALGRRAEAAMTLERALASIPEGHLVFGRWVEPLSHLLSQWSTDGR